MSNYWFKQVRCVSLEVNTCKMQCKNEVSIGKKACWPLGKCMLIINEKE